jgi:hypothetical protein
MTSSRYTLVLALLVLTAVASAFQVSVPASHAKKIGRGRMTNNDSGASTARHRMVEDEKSYFASTAVKEETTNTANGDDAVKDVTPFPVAPPPPIAAPASTSGGLSSGWFSW